MRGNEIRPKEANEKREFGTAGSTLSTFDASCVGKGTKKQLAVTGDAGSEKLIRDEDEPWRGATVVAHETSDTI